MSRKNANNDGSIRKRASGKGVTRTVTMMLESKSSVLSTVKLEKK